MLAGLLSATLLAAATAETTVTSVRVVDDAGRDASRFRRLVELSPGAPLDGAAVRHAVELLHATGEVRDVVVEATPASHGGMDLTFRLLPAPRLTEIRVEGDRVLDAGALRRITGLRQGEPLWPSRLERAGRDAALSLAADGYLEARVEPAARPVPGGAQAVFTVRTGPRVRVARLALVGAPSGPAAELEAKLRPRPGRVFRRAEAEAAAEDVRKRLVEVGRWRARVAPEPVYDPATARVHLVFRVDPGPRVELDFEGSRPPGGLRDDVRRLLREGGLGSDALEEATERIEEDYRQRGHRAAAVSYREVPRPGDRLQVVFAVEPGPAATVATVRIDGEEAERAGVDLATRAGEPLTDRLLDQDRRALLRALEDAGYAEARVDVEAPEGGGPVPVVFRLRAGPRTVVGSVTVEAAEHPPEAAVQELRLRHGRPYRVQDLAHDRNLILAAYRNAGFLEADVTPEVTFSADRSEARVVLRVAAGPRTEVDHIVITGLRATREEVVRREMLVREGEPLGLQKVLDSQRRLGSLGLFQRVNVAEMDPESRERRTLVVEAEEAPSTSVGYGAGYAERDLLRLGAEVARRNLGGFDRTVSVFLRASLKGNHRFLVNYREPYLFGRKLEMLATAFREEEDRELYDYVRYGSFIQTARRLTPQWGVILRYSFQEVRPFNIVDPDELDRQFAEITISGPSVSVVNDTRDDPLDPRRGRFLGADLLLSHETLGGNSFLKTFVQASAYRRLSSRVLMALTGRLGLSRSLGGADQPLPRPERFYAGGDFGLRGFKVDRVVPTGGNALLVGGAELRVDLKAALSVAAFSDLGNVYSLVRDLDPTELRYTAGLGVRYKSAIGPLRLDWGYKLNRRSGESPSEFHFTVGHAF
jgi:outer membrane protein insertion porin family